MIQFRKMVWVYVLPLNVVEAEMVRLPLTVIAPAAVFVFPLDKIR